MSAYLFLSETGPNTDHIDYIALNNTYIGEVTPTQSIKFLALSLPLFLLLSQALVTE